MKIKVLNLSRSFQALSNYACLIILLNLLDKADVAFGWGRSGNSDSSGTLSKYGMNFNRGWLSDSSSVAIEIDGCVWGTVADREDMLCMEDESEDGATMWYQMANCRRAQVAYSVYSTSSGKTSCSKNDWKESMVTKYGVAEFAYTMGSYGYYSPISEDDVGDLPICEEDGNGYYMGVGCSGDGKFTLDLYYDQYCLQYYDTYQELDDLNSAMSSVGCYSCYNSKVDEDPSYSLCAYLFPESGSCSETDSPMCKTNSFVSSQGTSKSATAVRSPLSGKLSFVNKLKYGMGSVMLFASCLMFVGILFANRRKRRAMMHRKFRSNSKSGNRKTSSKSKKRRSKSRTRSEREIGSGVLT